jgi:hypothetical protein
MKRNGSLYNVIKSNFENNFNPEMDLYAFMHSSSFQRIFGEKQRNSKRKDLRGYLKITNGKNKVYLKYQSRNSIKGNEVMLSHMNCAALNTIPNKLFTPEVHIYKSNWFIYSWHNSDSASRNQFRWAFVGFLSLFIMEIPQFIHWFYSIYK